MSQEHKNVTDTDTKLAYYYYLGNHFYEEMEKKNLCKNEPKTESILFMGYILMENFMIQ